MHLGDAVDVEGVKGSLPMRVVGKGVFPTTSDAYPLADGAYVTAAALPVLGTGDSSNGLGVAYRPGADRAQHTRVTASMPRAAPVDAAHRAAPPGEIENLRRVKPSRWYSRRFSHCSGSSRLRTR